MSLIDDYLNDDVSAAQIAMKTQSGAYQVDNSANWQSQLLGIGTNYLNGLAQIELAKRYASTQTPQIASTQAPINTDLTTRAASSLGSVRLGNLLPFLLLGFGLYAVMGRGR